MWNTFTAGLQRVQEKLEDVLDDSLGKQDQDEADEGSPSSSPIVSAEPTQESHLPVIADPPTPSRVEEGPDHGDGKLEAMQSRIGILVEEKDRTEQQVQIINTEYRRLLAEKEAEIKSLKERDGLGQGGGGGGEDHTHKEGDHTHKEGEDCAHNLEIAQKELAAHKEVVSELRDQLVNKDAELQELSVKAETKFNKLRAQAKSKITSLTKEMDRMKEERGEVGGAGGLSPNTSLNVSALDESPSAILSPSSSTEHAQQLDVLSREVADLRKEVEEREQSLQAREAREDELREELCRGEKETQQLRDDFAACKDKLNVSDVCLQKEQENRVTMELQMSDLEEQLDKMTSDFSVARADRDGLKAVVESHTAENEMLSLEVQDLTAKVDYLSSQAERKGAEEENCPVSETCDEPAGREEGVAGVSPMVSVLAAGERGSLIDMESEISRLEAVIKERDTQLSSFKTVLEEKEVSLHQLQQSQADLTAHVQEVESTCLSKDDEISTLSSGLTGSSQEVSELKARVEKLEVSLKQVEFRGQELEDTVREKSSRLVQLEAEIAMTQESRTKIEQELTSKQTEFRSLSECIESQERVIREKSEEVSRMEGEIEVLENSVQLSNDSLRETVEGSEESAKILETSSKKMQDLESRVLELKVELETEKRSVGEARMANGQLEMELTEARGRLNVLEEKAVEAEGVRTSFSSHRDELKQQVRELDQQVLNLQGQLQASVAEKDQIVLEMETNIEKREEEIEVLKSDKDKLVSQCSELQMMATSCQGALGFAQNERSSKDDTIKELSGSLEQVTSTAAVVEKELAHLKEQNVEKMQEALQKNEQNARTKVLLEEATQKVEQTEEELEKARVELEMAAKEKENLSTQLNMATSRVGVLEREKGDSMVESETLRGQVGNLSDVRASLVQEQSKHREELSGLTSKLSQNVEVTKELQSKMQSSRKKIGSLTTERDEAAKKREELEVELSRNMRENEQMKQQFESAVKLMDSKLSQQAVTTNRLAGEIDMKERTIASLKEQLAADSRKTSEMLERVQKVSADYKVSSDRCRLLESERGDLQRRVRELEASNSHLQHVYSEALTEREQLHSEREAALTGMQEQEARVMTLTEQLAQTAREKHVGEGKLRELGKQLLASEHERTTLRSTLEEIRTQADGVRNVNQERLVWSEERSRLEQEAISLRDRVQELSRSEEGVKARATELEARATEMEARATEVQADVARLQRELKESHEHAEALQGRESQAASSGDAQGRLQELEHAHTVEKTRLQQSHGSQLADLQQQLKEEREQRKQMEQSQRDIAISMDDATSMLATGGGVDAAGNTQPKTLVDYVNVGVSWTQRLVKNPNIVLTRLLRTTPQTKLFFLAYFIIIHLLLLYLVIT